MIIQTLVNTEHLDDQWMIKLNQIVDFTENLLIIYIVRIIVSKLVLVLFQCKFFLVLTSVCRGRPSSVAAITENRAEGGDKRSSGGSGGMLRLFTQRFCRVTTMSDVCMRSYCCQLCMIGSVVQFYCLSLHGYGVVTVVLIRSGHL